MTDLYAIQPASCRASLEYKEFPFTESKYYTATWTLEQHRESHQRWQRIVLLDPTIYFDRIRYIGDAYSRIQVKADTFAIQDLFINVDNKCACGCGVKLKGRQRRWASEDCGLFGFYVRSILAGRHEEIKKALGFYYFGQIWGELACTQCGDMDAGIEIDHVVPVHKGGGCCWLSNYQFLCVACHKKKTYEDVHRKITNQLTINL